MDRPKSGIEEGGKFSTHLPDDEPVRRLETRRFEIMASDSSMQL